jgi:hypothetical protein
MEELQTTIIEVEVQGRKITCRLKEKDYGEYIVYDVYEGDQYLLTMSKDGDVLFNEPEMSGNHDIMDPRILNEVIEQLRLKMS